MAARARNPGVHRGLRRTSGARRPHTCKTHSRPRSRRPVARVPPLSARTNVRQARKGPAEALHRGGDARMCHESYWRSFTGRLPLPSWRSREALSSWSRSSRRPRCAIGFEPPVSISVAQRQPKRGEPSRRTRPRDRGAGSHTVAGPASRACDHDEFGQEARRRGAINRNAFLPSFFVGKRRLYSKAGRYADVCTVRKHESELARA